MPSGLPARDEYYRPTRAKQLRRHAKGDRRCGVGMQAAALGSFACAVQLSGGWPLFASLLGRSGIYRRSSLGVRAEARR